jgi:hypothetical protein
VSQSDMSSKIAALKEATLGWLFFVPNCAASRNYRCGILFRRLK